MRIWIGIGVTFLLIIIVVGLAITRTKYLTLPEEPPVACEIRTFDYIWFLENVRHSIKRTSEFISQTERNNEDPLQNEKLIYFRSKLDSLKHLIPLVEKQVRNNGSTYGCTHDGYFLLMHHLYYPSFSHLPLKEQYESILGQIDEKRYQNYNLLQVVLNPLAIVIVGLLGFWVGMKGKK
ncbi:hypothetical protein MYX76_12115 [Desulfobacterota bacterium AH_259_B03_O07]|nr:hypothetical protein [Desulfobacterota bacterium AH_259_B03_O07]